MMNYTRRKAGTALRWVSVAAATLLAAMVGIGFVTGVSQQTFELYQPAQNYANALQAQAGPLRIILGLDNVFIACYSAVVLCFVLVLDEAAPRFVLGVVAACGLAGGLLDFLENHHIALMLNLVQAGGQPTNLEIGERVVFSMLKWHLAYFAFFLVGLVLPRRNVLERAFAFSLIFLQLPVGVAYYVFEGTSLGTVLFYARYANLGIGFLLIAWFFGRAAATATDRETKKANAKRGGRPLAQADA